MSRRPEVNEDALLCPSAQPSEPGARVFGVQSTQHGPDRRVGYLAEAVPVTPEILALSGKAAPAEVLRMAAPCMRTGCMNYQGGACGLAGRVARMLEPVVNALPACAIRRHCRWFAEQGPAACLRCPQVVTTSRAGSGLPVEVAYADPDTAPELSL
jgi:hypothetical protein